MRWRAMLTVAILGLSMPALACSIMQPQDRFPYDDNSSPVDAFIAARMWENAAHIDVAEIVGVDEPSSYQERQGPHPREVVFRVVNSLKGGASDEFLMPDSGVFLSEADRNTSEPSRNMHTVTFDGRIEPFHPYEADCRSSFLSVSVGHRYLVFRDADGKLLGPVALYADMPASQGYSLVRLGRAGRGPGDGQWERINDGLKMKRPRLEPISRPGAAKPPASAKDEAHASCSPKAVARG